MAAWHANAVHSRRADTSCFHARRKLRTLDERGFATVLDITETWAKIDNLVVELAKELIIFCSLNITYVFFNLRHKSGVPEFEVCKLIYILELVRNKIM